MKSYANRLRCSSLLPPPICPRLSERHQYCFDSGKTPVDRGFGRRRSCLKKDIYALEPNISAICGLLLSGIWVIDQKSLGTQLVREMEGIGVDIRLRTEIKSISFNGEYAVFGTDTAEESVTHVINSAGLHADIIARMAGFDAPEISPVRGEYYEVFSDKKISFIHTSSILRSPRPSGERYTLHKNC